MSVITDFKEKSSGTATITLDDENGDIIDAGSIASLNYTLTTEDGVTIINGKEQVPITPITNPVDVVLEGDDLEIFDNEQNKKFVTRLMTVEGTYDSLLANDLPINQDKTFTVRNLKYITNP